MHFKLARCRALSLAVTAAVSAVIASKSPAETVSLDPRNAVYQSTGASEASDYNLFSNGYVGTFIQLNQAADVTVTVSAEAQLGNGIGPAMTMSLAGQNTTVNVNNTNGFQNYTSTIHLNPGTYNFDAQFNNDFNGGSGNDRNLLLQNFTFSTPNSSGLQVINPVGNAAGLNQVVQNASDSYITNYREKSATVTIRGANGQPLAAGTPVHVVYAGQQTNPSFNFGTAVFGVTPSDTTWLTGTDPQDVIYRNFLNTHFNDIEPENAGKWASDEVTQGNVDMSVVDAMTAYAKAHGMNVRMHNLIWGSQQPDFINNLLTNAMSSDPTTAANAKAALSQAIANRIQYYVANRATTFSQLDVLNEALTGGSGPGSYWQVYGPDGIAAIYNQVNQALAAHGGSAKVYTNEYNVLQYSADTYSNWYLNEVNQLNASGGPGTVSGIGIQYYPVFGDSNNDPENLGRIFGVLQNLSVAHLPMALTEFGVQGNANPTPQDVANVLADALRAVFGTPEMNTFQMWGFMEGHLFTPESDLIDSNGNLTPAGEVWEQMLGIHNWNLSGVPFWGMDQTLLTDANGQIDFNGFLGQYSLTFDGQTTGLDFNGPGSFTVGVPLPSSALMALAGLGVCLIVHRRIRRVRQAN